MIEAYTAKAHIAGAYSIADIALLPWIRALQKWEIALTDCPHLARRYECLCARPAVIRGFEVPTALGSRASSMPLSSAADKP